MRSRPSYLRTAIDGTRRSLAAHGSRGREKIRRGIDQSIRQIAKLRKQLDDTSNDGEQIDFTQPMASATAQTTDGLHQSPQLVHVLYRLRPMFTWWATAPYKDLDKALADYSKSLRDHGKKAPEASQETASVRPYEPAPGEVSDVPDLNELLAFPRSDMRGVLDRFRSTRRGGNRKPEFYQGWLDALAAIDFDKLSRNGQIEYLLIKNSLTHDLNRLNLPKGKISAPKDSSGIRGTPIGRAAMLNDLAGEMIPYTPEELIAIAKKEFAWCDTEMLQASSEMGFGDDWKKALEKVKTLTSPPASSRSSSATWRSRRSSSSRRTDLVTLPPLQVETLADGDDDPRAAAT